MLSLSTPWRHIRGAEVYLYSFLTFALFLLCYILFPRRSVTSRLSHRPLFRQWPYLEAERKLFMAAHTHTRYQHFDRQSMKRACPWQRLLLHIGDKTTITRLSIVWTTANTLNVSVRHLTGMCEEHCRRLQNTDSDTLAQCSTVSPSRDTHKSNVHHVCENPWANLYKI
jgi:hypothetical protein